MEQTYAHLQLIAKKATIRVLHFSVGNVWCNVSCNVWLKKLKLVVIWEV